MIPRLLPLHDTYIIMPESTLALHGGSPIRNTMLPYGRQQIDDQSAKAVLEALFDDFLTTGPRVSAFEQDICNYTTASYGVAVNNGTAALHTAMNAIGIGPGDEVIVPAITFVATSNAVLMQGGTPVIADTLEGSLLIDPKDVERKITKKTKAIIAVDYAGQPCHYDELRTICDKYNCTLVDDACHSIGATYKNKAVGTLADLNIFSFHPVKPITTGEGGMITTKNKDLADRMRKFRNHGISKTVEQRQNEQTWEYDINELGYNYRLTDFQSALGSMQLKLLPRWIQKRQSIAKKYDDAFVELPNVSPLTQYSDRTNGYHLYVILLETALLNADRKEIFSALRAEGIGVNVHYIPLHLHKLYQTKLGTKEGLCPIAEDAYSRMITLPLFAGMTEQDSDDVIAAVQKVCKWYNV